jgi:hypothetical protein
VLGAFTLVVTALTDITYAYADPRSRSGGHPLWPQPHRARTSPFTNVNGTWISVVEHEVTFIGYSDIYLVLSINGQGQIKGNGEDCPVAYGLIQTSLNVSGYTDGTTLHLSLIGQGELYILQGDFPKTADAFNLAGGFNGAKSAWQALCKQPG